MKTMTCKQLGGACDKEFQANSFEEIAQLSQEHGKEMHEQQDETHLQVMQQMRERMQQPGAMEEWMRAKKREFDALPDSP